MCTLSIKEHVSVYCDINVLIETRHQIEAGSQIQDGDRNHAVVLKTLWGGAFFSGFSVI